MRLERKKSFYYLFTEISINEKYNWIINIVTHGVIKVLNFKAAILILDPLFCERFSMTVKATWGVTTNDVNLYDKLTFI